MTSLEAYRQQKNVFFAGVRSPLLPEQRARFEGLSYYPVDMGQVYHLAIERAEPNQWLEMATSTGQWRAYLKWATVEVPFAAGAQQLLLLATEEAPSQLFLPFRDASSGVETYGAGRYLDVPYNSADDTVTLDFNRCYNPYCAYAEGWTCPIPPSENHVKSVIGAGELQYLA